MSNNKRDNTANIDALLASVTEDMLGGDLGDDASLSSGKLYFTQRTSSSVDPFHACGDYLMRLSRRDGDMKHRRYFYVGKRHGVQIFEPFNPVTNTPETYLNQRLIWRESDSDFEQARTKYGRAVQSQE